MPPKNSPNLFRKIYFNLLLKKLTIYVRPGEAAAGSGSAPARSNNVVRKIGAVFLFVLLFPSISNAAFNWQNSPCRLIVWPSSNVPQGQWTSALETFTGTGQYWGKLRSGTVGWATWLPIVNMSETGFTPQNGTTYTGLKADAGYKTRHVRFYHWSGVDWQYVESGNISSWKVGASSQTVYDSSVNAGMQGLLDALAAESVPPIWLGPSDAFPSDPETGCSPPPPPDPCLPFYDALKEDCKGSDDPQYNGQNHIAYWDNELCEGYCKTCGELREFYDDICFSSAEHMTVWECEQVPAMSLEPIEIAHIYHQCGDVADCSDRRDGCISECGGIDNIEYYNCTQDNGVPDMNTYACQCNPNDDPPPPDPDDPNDPPTDTDDPDSKEDDPSNTDSEKFGKIVTNTGATADNTHNINENAKVIAGNTKSIADGVIKMNDNLGGKLDNIKGAITGEGALTDQVKSLGTSIDNMGSDIEDIEGILKNDYTGDSAETLLGSVDVDTMWADQGTEMSDMFTTELGSDQVSSDSLDSSENKITSFFATPGTCTPIDLSFREHEFYLDCDMSDIIKMFLSFLLAFYTAYYVYDTILTQMRGDK